MTAYQEAVKRYTDAGGTWPPGPPWPGSGRYDARSMRRVRA